MPTTLPTDPMQDDRAVVATDFAAASAHTIVFSGGPMDIRTSIAESARWHPRHLKISLDSAKRASLIAHDLAGTHRHPEESFALDPECVVVSCDMGVSRRYVRVYSRRTDRTWLVRTREVLIADQLYDRLAEIVPFDANYLPVSLPRPSAPCPQPPEPSSVQKQRDGQITQSSQSVSVIDEMTQHLDEIEALLHKLPPSLSKDNSPSTNSPNTNNNNGLLRAPKSCIDLRPRVNGDDDNVFFNTAAKRPSMDVPRPPPVPPLSPTLMPNASMFERKSSVPMLVTPISQSFERKGSIAPASSFIAVTPTSPGEFSFPSRATTPVYEPTTPIYGSITPVNRPTAPINRPTTPVNRPTTPENVLAATMRPERLLVSDVDSAIGSEDFGTHSPAGSMVSRYGARRSSLADAGDVVPVFATVPPLPDRRRSKGETTTTMTHENVRLAVPDDSVPPRRSYDMRRPSFMLPTFKSRKDEGDETAGSSNIFAQTGTSTTTTGGAGITKFFKFGRKG